MIYWIYIGIYTPMKRISTMNTHVGAISGSLPTSLGFAAAGSPLLISYHSFILPDPFMFSFFTYMMSWQY
jgi:heme O synthase-like polyprenyltransferase